METLVVGNRDKCGRCDAIHGGNNHYCHVHGKVSEGCCETPCNSSDYVRIGGLQAVLRSSVDLSGYKLDPPYAFQDDGTGNYKPNFIERYVKIAIP